MLLLTLFFRSIINCERKTMPLNGWNVSLYCYQKTNMQMPIIESQVGVVKGNRIDSVDNGKCVMACGPKYFQNAPNSLIQFKCKDVSSGHLQQQKIDLNQRTRESLKKKKKGKRTQKCSKTYLFRQNVAAQFWWMPSKNRLKKEGK